MLNAVAGVFKELPRLLEETPAVVVVLTTNYRDRIDESLTRKGRIDRHLEIPRPDEAARSDIFHKKLTRLIEQYERPSFMLVADDVEQLAAARPGSPALTSRGASGGPSTARRRPRPGAANTARRASGSARRRRRRDAGNR